MIGNLVLGIADATAQTLRLVQPPLNPDRLIAKARRRTGLHEFGSTDFLDHLRVFLSACEREASLSLIGRMATRWDVIRFLRNLLRFREAEARSPDILRERIQQPIFITGLPRSGTTFLHRLLMLDDGNSVPRIWQTIYPYPLSDNGARGVDARVDKVESQLRMFARMAPEFRRLHPVTANSPQECSEITAHVFASLRFDTTYDIPSYRQWLDAVGHLTPYRFHKRFLQHLQHQAGAGQWVLKCPDHVFALEEIRTVYPDARIVFVHRDPLKVLPSNARLTEVLRRPFTRQVDRAHIGAQESRRWHEGIVRMIAESKRTDLRQPVFHVHHTELVADPLKTIQELYTHFESMLGPSTERRILESTAQEPNGGYGANSYSFEDHGLDPGTERERFAEYMQHFAVDPEVGGRTPPKPEKRGRRKPLAGAPALPATVPGRAAREKKGRNRCG